MKKIHWAILIIAFLIGLNAILTKTEWWQEIEAEMAVELAYQDSIENARQTKENALKRERLFVLAMQHQATEVLKKSLHDPESYQPGRWSEITTKDSVLFVFRHEYRAKNAFGGLVKESKTFTVHKSGRVVGVE